MDNYEQNNLPSWLIEEMLAYLYSNNIIMKNKDLSGVVHVPVMINPSPVLYS
jgi:hypothetical protein